MTAFKRFAAVLLALLMAFSLFACTVDIPDGLPTESPSSTPIQSESASPQPEEPPIDPDGWYYDPESVVLYLYTYGTLPSNYVTKSEARDLGWEGGSVERYLEGSAIGGDRFGNREGLLPKAEGRTYTECDINTNGAAGRGAERLVFSNDGLYFYTDDHYNSFYELYVTEEGTVEWK